MQSLLDLVGREHKGCRVEHVVNPAVARSLD